MQKLVEDSVSDDLLAASDANMAAFWSAYGHGNGCSWHATSEVVWFYTGIPDALFNGVVAAKLKPEGVKATVDSLQAKIEAQGAPAFWWVGPRSRPDNLGALLEGYGLQPAGEVPSMAMNLALLEHTPEAIAGFTIQEVIGAEMQGLWARIAAVGTELSPAAIEAMARVEATLCDPDYRAQHRYIGYLHGAPVATAALALASGVAGIYAVATIPEARRQGIGRIMTVTCLLEARQSGYQVGILQASPMGYPIYKRIGFRDVSKYRIYLQTGKES